LEIDKENCTPGLFFLGYDWQRFLKVLKLATGDIILWVLKDCSLV